MRILTLVVEANQPEADWIWESHKKNEFTHGVIASMICTGDKIHTLEKECRSLHEKTKADGEIIRRMLKEKFAYKKEILSRIFNELMCQEVGHDWELLDEYVKDLSYTNLYFELKIANIGGDWNKNKEEIMNKAKKIAECLERI